MEAQTHNRYSCRVDNDEEKMISKILLRIMRVKEI